MLRLAVMRLSRRLRQERSSTLSPTQIGALATLERHGPMTLGEVAAHADPDGGHGGMQAHRGSVAGSAGSVRGSVGAPVRARG